MSEGWTIIVIIVTILFWGSVAITLMGEKINKDMARLLLLAFFWPIGLSIFVIFIIFKFLKLLPIAFGKEEN